MKKIFFIISFTLVAFTIYAQQDPEAKKILDKLSQKTKSYKNIEAGFKVDYIDLKDKIKNSSEGTITMQGEKYRLNFMDTEVFFDGKTLWSYIKDANEVNISEPENDDSDILNNPQKLFTIYEKDFKYQLISRNTEGGTSNAIVDLYPFELEKDYSRIRLQINTSTFQLKSATIFGKDGSSYSVSIFNFNTNIQVETNYFTFIEANYPGVEIIDMRW
ncbi:MAG: hypothetical protein A2X13_00510 [Bacteroidetes bacterium GWC2_33_15]|nr:MAG: hypothetical protein A2X10_04320 [Bacteroidetes bacterium GWA2_33_15]OFX51102.1 MAG: hypothetical protein A2X13_00510 [Bacteroidetes bacterium GWC2_33_15]OFX66464.1 MAG: hypothetical protein A2X15_07445 [Bacteroidetes bacterium GWB2_32_14]OFX70310.1 MAG: hypothetical protein A2X14_03400 [Bacteroidetes bacterium GWD2_33_33]